MKNISEFLKLDFENPHFAKIQSDAWTRPVESPLRLSGLTDSAKAFFAVQAFHQSRQNVLWICESAREYELVKSDLLSLLSSDELLCFPSSGLLPWESGKPESHAAHERFETLQRLQSSKKPYFLISTYQTAMEFLPPKLWMKSNTLKLKVNDDYPFDEVREVLGDLGYREEPQVENVGEFSIRASIIDLYPYGSETPYRLDFFDETLEHIHTFDLFTQRTAKRSLQKSLKVESCGEWVVPQTASIQEDLSKSDSLKIRNARIEGLEHDFGVWLRNWFYEEFYTLIDLHQGLVFSSSESALREKVSSYWVQLNSRYQSASKQFIVPPPQRVFQSLEPWLKQLSSFARMDFSQIDWSQGDHQAIEAQERTSGQIEEVRDQVEELINESYEVYFVSNSQSQAKRLSELVTEWDVSGVLIGHLHGGFTWHEAKVAFFTDHQIFNRMSRRKQGKRYQGGVSIPSFDQLQRGDFIIHEDYGVGRFIGTQRIAHGEVNHDCLILEYRGKDRLTLPVSDLSKLEKFIGGEGKAPSLHSLGGKVWEKAKEKAKKSAIKVAQELVQLYAKRQFIEGTAFPKDGKMQKDFENSFAYDPTPDQTSATSDIKSDLQKLSPMDRLICGDVGFGKTEVAMRAAFKVVSNNKQVAVLVPTTILASQHYQNFQERFADWPVRVELLNRFRTAKEKKKVIEETNLGKVDILVGTHALLSDKVKFQNLGLYIIDEEQKFGVKQKEKLREKRLEVDTLAMSATPIPRTLHLSLAGVRDISLITTPPMNRLAVETRVQKFSPEHLAEGVKYELERGGQCFVVNDHIKELGFLADHIENQVPQARVAIAHGQMNEKDLEQIMAAFVNQEYDVLVSTTIVENGIDISTANSIFIYNSHRFGISQLYQLRGRVGRGDVQGHARLFVPSDHGISDDSEKRLEALATHTDLGSGYQLAMRDLEVRGSGNLLGPEQSGHISEIGIETYIKMVQEAVIALQGQERIPDIEPELKIPVNSFIPESYIEEGVIRLQIYQRLSRIKQFRDFKDIQNELEERFGPLPESVQYLVQFMMLRQCCKILGFKVLELTSREAALATPIPEVMKNQEFLNSCLSKSDLPWRILYNEPIQIQFELDSKGYIKQLIELVKVFIKMTHQLSESSSQVEEEV